MEEENVKTFLQKQLGFDKFQIKKIILFVNELISFNKSYNLIAKSTEKNIWHRHVLDSAQICRFIDFNNKSFLSDLGSGAGFPGVILDIFNHNSKFHVKLYEKSPVKADFLEQIKRLTKSNYSVINEDVKSKELSSDYVVCRAFKKLPEIIRISRENNRKNHKLIILKGKSAQEEIINASKQFKLKYRLEDSITDKESKIILIDVNKDE